MPPLIASAIFGALIWGLFRLERRPHPAVSPALWLPVAWMLLAGSRALAQWFNVGPAVEAPEQYLEGNPLDRLVLTALLATGLWVLSQRATQVRRILGANWPIVLFFIYAGVSIMWSDYSWVAFKRWIRASGNVVMILVILTEADPVAAVKRFLARTGFLLIPLSVLLIKYYPDLGRSYNMWTWTTHYVGVASGKNGLGFLCLVFGLASISGLLQSMRIADRKQRLRGLGIHCVILSMTLWLIVKANSMTSLACLIFGSLIICITSLRAMHKQPTAIHCLVAVASLLALFGVLIGAQSDIVDMMGRDATLTGRTLLWDELLSMSRDPVLGTGFESFWLGDRMQSLWTRHWWRPDQAHNGYIEIFVNLGMVGLALLAVVVVAGYRTVVQGFRHEPHLAGLKLAFFLAALVYNVTEAAFKGSSPVWICFLWASMSVPTAPARELAKPLARQAEHLSQFRAALRARHSQTHVRH
jgi:exopolysaccharide production protein ExoQ